MNFAELRSALTRALDSGHIGQPVAIRLHLRFGNGQVAAEQLLVGLAPIMADVFGDSYQRVMARSAEDRGQINLLLEYESGATALVTLVTLGETMPCLHLVLIGNHGIIRLEGGPDIQLSDTQTADSRLLGLIKESLACGAPVGAE